MTSSLLMHSRNQSLAVSAFDRVSIVVNDLDARMNKVVSWFKPRNKLEVCVPSIDEMKCKLTGECTVCKLWVIISGPRSDPPTPIFTTSVIGLHYSLANVRHGSCRPFASFSAKRLPRHPAPVPPHRKHPDLGHEGLNEARGVPRYH